MNPFRWASAGAEVALLGTEFDAPILAAVRSGRAHPALGVTLHPALTYRSCDEWGSVLPEADVVVVAVSSAGLRDPVTIGAQSARADATWVIENVRIPVAGRWLMRVEILISDFEKVTLEEQVTLPRMP